MKFDLQTIWQNALEILEHETSPVSFNTWIKDLKPIEIEGNSFILQSSEDFFRGMIKSRYQALITNVLKQICNKEFDVQIVIPGELEKTSTSNSEGSSADAFEASVTGNLNPRYVFDTFVVGNSNRMAHAAALAVSEAPAKAYNPLFIYGGAGLGKTHLMHSVGHFIHGTNPSSKIMYVTSETFTNELINSIRDDKNEAFRNKYRTIDVLLIDDIQFIGGKERTQEEFFHTFNTLREANKQIIISSDRPPKEIPTLEDRLRSRFEWGLIADIQPPDLETRIAILRKKANLDKLTVPNEVTVFVANKIESNIRELEGALNRIVAFASLTGREITIDLANEALKDLFSTNKPRQITPDFIMDVVSSHYNLKSEDLKSKKRTRSIAFPRQIAMFLCRDLTDLSLPKIGEAFGGRDHTTVIHACEKIHTDLNKDANLSSILEDLKKKIQQ